MDGSFAVIFSNGRKNILLVKRRDIPIWVLPGGGIESGETPDQAVVREVFEETGYRVEVVKKVGEYFYPKKDKVNHIYECSIKGGVKTLSNESKAVDEFDIKQLPDLISPHVPIYINDAFGNSKEIIKKEMPGYGKSLWIKGLLHPWALFKYLLTTIGIHWNT